MQRYVLLPFLVLVFTGCAGNETSGSTPSTDQAHKMMPDINQGASPDQRRAIMSGEKPDWNEIYYPTPHIPVRER